jgi:hypothetical protein
MLLQKYDLSNDEPSDENDAFAGMVESKNNEIITEGHTAEGQSGF